MYARGLCWAVINWLKRPSHSQYEPKWIGSDEVFSWRFTTLFPQSIETLRYHLGTWRVGCSIKNPQRADDSLARFNSLMSIELRWNGSVSHIIGYNTKRSGRELDRMWNVSTHLLLPPARLTISCTCVGFNDVVASRAHESERLFNKREKQTHFDNFFVTCSYSLVTKIFQIKKHYDKLL